MRRLLFFRNCFLELSSEIYEPVTPQYIVALWESVATNIYRDRDVLTQNRRCLICDVINTNAESQCGEVGIPDIGTSEVEIVIRIYEYISRFELIKREVSVVNGVFVDNFGYVAPGQVQVER